MLTLAPISCKLHSKLATSNLQLDVFNSKKLLTASTTPFQAASISFSVMLSDLGYWTTGTLPDMSFLFVYYGNFVKYI